MRTLLALLAALLVAGHVRAETPQAELDRLLAPVALYPDALLSQVLMAATYPLDVVEAARWAREHRGLRGDEAVGTAHDKDWDPSVKSLLAFPELLARMDEQLEWTRALGETFLAEEPRVMETVQQLRRRAQAEGRLLADERLRAVDDGVALVVEYADPRGVCVPYYDPWVVYGAWWWPGDPPVVWTPWPGWGASIGVSVGFFFGAIDWPHRHVTVLHVHNHYVRARRGARVLRPLHVGRWQHAPSQPRALHPRRERPAPMAPLALPARPMPPALSTSPAPRPQGSQIRRRPPRAVPYDRPHGGPGRVVDRADRVGGARANAAQHRAARPHGIARHVGRNAGPLSVRPPVRPGVAVDRPRLAR
jgi:hypothetical protein